MRGLQLFGVSALVSNKDAIHRQSMGIESVQKPIQVEEHIFGRRRALQAILGGTAAAVVAPAASIALDMDAFVNSELEKDLKNCNPKTDKKCIPELTKDEAMCKYGQSGNARGEACKRVKEGGGPLPGASQTKSLGGAYAM